MKTRLIQIDPFRVEQIIKNLINNALRYSPNGSTVTGEDRESGERQSSYR